MLAAKFAAKKFGDAASETDPGSWNWASYVKGSVGAVLAGFAANMVRRGSGQKVLEGGLALMMYKAVQNELIVNSQWASEQFGQDDYIPDEYLLTGNDDDPYYYGQDGQLYPADNRHRFPEVQIGGALVPVGPLGETLEPVGPLGADPWRSAYVAS
jgi:hypothetical protein